MNAKATIKKILFIAIWATIGGGMLILLVAAIGRQNKDHCRDFAIRISGARDRLFADDKDVLKLLKSATNGNIQGQPKSSFHLLRIEKVLEKNAWIKDAELYFDNRNVLHVSIVERDPLARIFTVTGKSFYIDNSEKMMPLSDKVSARVPVFTGFPERILRPRDSLLLHQVRAIAGFIGNDPFWMAQVSQINITPEREFEMIPVVGNHIVLLGDGEDMERKFHRLFVFYKDVLSLAGFDAYKTINVEYKGQVIGVKDKLRAKGDTTQLRLNVEKLLKESREMQNDSLIAAREMTEQKTIKVDPEIAATEKNTAGENKSQPAESNPNPVLVTNPVPMKQFLEDKTGGKPKAVMQKRSQ